MEKNIFHMDGKNFQQINKTKARNFFESGKTVYLHPCKMSFCNPWENPVGCNKSETDGSFDMLVCCFETYNCNSETGKYTHFFVEI